MTALSDRWREAESHVQAYLEMTGPDLATMMLSSPPCHKLAQAACSLVAMELAHRISLRGTDGGPDEPTEDASGNLNTPENQLPDGTYFVAREIGAEPCVVDSPLASQPGEEPIIVDDPKLPASEKT